MADPLTLGRRAEAKALELLRLTGWRLLDRNWRCRCTGVRWLPVDQLG